MALNLINPGDVLHVFPGGQVDGFLRYGPPGLLFLGLLALFGKVSLLVAVETGDVGFVLRSHAEIHRTGVGPCSSGSVGLLLESLLVPVSDCIVYLC